MADETVREQEDKGLALEAIRICLHIWPFIMGLCALTPKLSTEAKILGNRGIPPDTLGVVMLAGGVLLIIGRFTTRGQLRRWTLAVGDFLVGTECILMASLMEVAAVRGNASWLSVGLWLLPGVLFELLSVLRVRGQ